jgi:hypothetical protein
MGQASGSCAPVPAASQAPSDEKASACTAARLELPAGRCDAKSKPKLTCGRGAERRDVVQRAGLVRVHQGWRAGRRGEAHACSVRRTGLGAWAPPSASAASSSSSGGTAVTDARAWLTRSPFVHAAKQPPLPSPG